MNWLNLNDIAEWIRSPGKAQNSPKGFPMFQTQDVQLVKKQAVGLSGRGSLLLAENVDTIWFVEVKDRKTPVGKQASQRFLGLKSELEEIHSYRFIRGIMLTSASFSEAVREALEHEDCLIIPVPKEQGEISAQIEED
ncbi:MAG TPA: hypothetical protein VKA68_17835 [bacterium]|nr:hypothetical protein [bacterium]